MAPIKRKSGPTNESFVRSKKVVQEDQHPSKRIKQDEPSQIAKSEAKNGTSSISRATYIARPQENESAFPRGGASILSPLEHKQIQIDATRDVLFEQAAATSKKANAEEDDFGTETQKVAPKSRSKKGKGKASSGPAEDEEPVVKIEGLSYKRLLSGSLVLGQVSAINAHDIALSLPNNLTGYVPITSISNKLSERIEEIAKADEDDNETTLADVNLESLFWLGQYLRAYVVSTGADGKPGEGSKRHIELSLQPQHANYGVSSEELVADSMVMASVISVEDHGLVMNLGLDESGVKGFMSSKELGQKVDFATVQEGAVFLCMITGLTPNGRTVKLSSDLQKAANLKKQNYLTSAPTIDAFLPGTAVEILVTDVTSKGLAGKIMGMVDVTADLIHSGAGSLKMELGNKYKLGSKVKARIICTFPKSEPRKLGVSLLEHVVSLSSQQTRLAGQFQEPLTLLPISAIVEEVTVKKVEPGVGLFVDVGIKGVAGFVHISRIRDEKIETISDSTGPYKLDTKHRGRVIGFNEMDGIYLISLEQKVLDQAFLRIEDIKVGDIVKGKVEKIVVNAGGVGGILVNLAENITGLVPEMHMADVSLLHPERKFKEGSIVTVRVLSTDPSRRQIRLTLKKTLINSEALPWKSYDDITMGDESPGTIVNLLATGAVVQFYGDVRGFLPVSEMSEAYINDPHQHFKVGQVVNVHAISVDPEEGKLLVSCKDPATLTTAQQDALKKLEVGTQVSAVVTEKSDTQISVDISGNELRATVPVGHLTDGSDAKNASLLKKIRVGQTLQNLLVIDKHESKHVIVLSNKPSLLQAADSHTFIRTFSDVKNRKAAFGFVKNITPGAVFVQFGGGVTGLLPKAKIPEKARVLPDFGFRRSQSLATSVISIDQAQERFTVSMVETTAENLPSEVSQGAQLTASNPVDNAITTIDDLELGTLTTAKIASIKDTQINVQLADNIQGRVDVSQIFNTWDEIKDRKHPLKQFSTKQLLNVRVLGIHDARNHRFLPISHRGAKNVVFELSAKTSDQTGEFQEPLTLGNVKKGSSWVAFVNNIGSDCLWVNLSPNVRGRIRLLDISDDISATQDLEGNFPVGSAIRVHVTGIDVANNRLDLSARSIQDTEAITLQTLSTGMILPGKVTRVNERQIMVQLSDNVSGPVNLTDLADDYSLANPNVHSKGDIVRVCITEIDAPNKRIRLSTRPSRVLNSSLEVKDGEITSVAQLKVNDVVRGFVKNVSDKGIFVSLGGNVTAYVRVSDLSDSYLKDWKSGFQVDQLVKGKVVVVDPKLNNVQLSLKSSIIDKDYVAPIKLEDLKVGQIITGKIRKVEDFGVFIVIDGSNNVSGLCHKSEMAEKRVEDVRKLYEEGDAVKAKVLKVEPEKRRVSFGLKVSYFDKSLENGQDSDVDMSDGQDEDSFDMDDENNISEDGGVMLGDHLPDSDEDDENTVMPEAPEPPVHSRMDAGAFDWSGNILDTIDDDRAYGSSDEDATTDRKKKKSRKPTIQVDRTGELDLNGPQSTNDFERLLLGEPESSQLWIEYMAFQMKLGELAKAREVAERAIKTISMHEETEKMNVWTALLNLENAYGSEDTVDEVFKRACQYNDTQEVHEKLASIYIQSGKHSKADDLFQIIIKKFSQSPDVWYNYAHFLHTTLSSAERARALLPRAIQSLPPHTHLNLTIKFAALEFHSPVGSPERGRTMFEGLLTTFPKRLDLWNQLLDLECQQGDSEIIRALFERVVKIKGLKPKNAKAWFRRWSVWEDENGDKKTREKVRAKAEEWVQAAAAAKTSD